MRADNDTYLVVIIPRPNRTPPVLLLPCSCLLLALPLPCPLSPSVPPGPIPPPFLLPRPCVP